jgi:hypothetical protein
VQIGFPFRLLALLLCPFIIWAQPATQFVLNDLSAFHPQDAHNWSVVKDISMHPFKSGKVKTVSGTGVLTGKPGNNLQTKQIFENLHLAFDFVVSVEALGTVTLPGNVKIRLADNPIKKAPDHFSTGFTGEIPMQDVAMAAGLWQQLEVNYDAVIPGKPGYSRMNYLKINGMIVQQNKYYPTVSAQAPLKLEIQQGVIGFRNINAIPLLTKQPIQLADLSFKRYSDGWDKDQLVKLEEQAAAPVLTQEYGQGAKEFHLVFDGNLKVDEAGEYHFSYIYTGSNGQLDINGQTIIKHKESSSQEIHRGSIHLTEGTHPFTLRFSKIPWRSAALGLIVEKTGIKPYALHALSSLPEPDPKPHITVTPVIHPEMIRSFVSFQDEKQKRTHCFSVGTPEGWHYTMDLNKAALLQVWRGNFANTTEMWYDRGEPQLLSPEGLTRPLSGKSSFVLSSEVTNSWPDSSGFDFKGYTLDKDRLPEIRFQKEQTVVFDKITPSQNGISRTVRVEGSPILLNLACADRIVQIEKNLFRIGDEYYIKTAPKTKTTVKLIGEKQYLIQDISQRSAYSIIW